ncbi:MAG: C39 family peptidase [Candidatus Thorarchaeota archaeon]
MRYTKPFSSILVIIVVSILVIPIGFSTVDLNGRTSDLNFSLSEEVSDVPYVWQEINGFCFPSALSMVLQSIGLDLSLYDILASSGAGFSAVSISVDETMIIYPGVFVRQISWFAFFTDLYGLEMQFYIDSSTDFGYYGKQIVESTGSTYIDYNDENMGPFDVMRESIDAGYPLAISCDTYYLPVEDWDLIRDYVGPLVPGGVGHAIVIVGYNDTSNLVRVYDPGVGLGFDNRGYPDDGRWNYTMSYAELFQAWQSAGFATFRVSNGTGQVADYESRLASYISNRLIGNRSTYFEGYENYYFMGTGAEAFRGMGLDMCLEAIRDYSYNYMEIDKANALRRLGQNLEAMITMEYYAFRGSLESLPNLLPSIDLEAFLDEASEAIPHFEALSHNDTVSMSIDIPSRDTLLYNTFFGIADRFDATWDLDASISEFSNGLDQISGHLIAIADAWKAAGEALSQELGGSPRLLNSDLTVVIGGGAAILIVGVILVIWRRNSNQID